MRDNGASPYCMKEDTRIDGPWEFGIKPVKPDSKVDWQEVWEKAKEGDLMAIPDSIRVQHYTKLRAITKDHLVINGVKDHLKGEWWYGPSGAGKSKTAREEHPDCYKKLCNKWFDGYIG